MQLMTASPQRADKTLPLRIFSAIYGSSAQQASITGTSADAISAHRCALCAAEP